MNDCRSQLPIVDWTTTLAATLTPAAAMPQPPFNCQFNWQLAIENRQFARVILLEVLVALAIFVAAAAVVGAIHGPVPCRAPWTSASRTAPPTWPDRSWSSTFWGKRR